MSKPTAAPRSTPLAVYVHFPWCLKKCPYCDFLSVERRRDRIDHDGYADQILSELRHRLPNREGVHVASVFFGGGTPSLWKPSAVGRIVTALVDRTEVDTDCEVTVECNPNSLDRQRADALAEAGVNRLSVGVQSLSQDRLTFLGRLHTPEEARAAVADAVASAVERVSADLIFGVAGQSASAAADEAARVADLGVTHQSCYALTIEAGTLFGARARKGRLPLLDEATVADSFEAVAKRLSGYGFMHYEVSNYARAGHESQHNLSYWRGREYLGLGCGAVGTLDSKRIERGSVGRVRYRNTQSPERYMALGFDTVDLYAADAGAVCEVEPLDPNTLLSEVIMLGLRLAEGVDIDAAARRLGAEPWPDARQKARDRLLDEGTLERIGGRLRIARHAWLHADGVIASLM